MRVNKNVGIGYWNIGWQVSGKQLIADSSKVIGLKLAGQDAGRPGGLKVGQPSAAASGQKPVTGYQLSVIGYLLLEPG